MLSNGDRIMTMFNPYTESDPRLIGVLHEVSTRMRTCDSPKYGKKESPVIKEIQLIMNQSNENADQAYHIDSFMNNRTVTILLSTGLDEKDEYGTLTMMHHGGYMDMFKLPAHLKNKHKITQDDWEVMLVDTVTMMNQALSEEGCKEGLNLHSFSEQERGIWEDLLIGNGVLNADGGRLPENELTNSMYDNCNRNKHKVGDGILFNSNRIHKGTRGNNTDTGTQVEKVREDFNGRLVMYIAFDSELATKESNAHFLLNTSLVIYMESLFQKLSLSQKSEHISKRSGMFTKQLANGLVKDHFKDEKSICIIPGDGNCQFGSVAEGLQWALCWIRDNVDKEVYATCQVYDKIVKVATKHNGVILLRQMMCGVLEEEFLNGKSCDNEFTTEPIVYDVEAKTFHAKVCTAFIDLLGSRVTMPSQLDVAKYIRTMRTNKVWGDIISLLTMRFMFRKYVQLAKCQFTKDKDDVQDECDMDEIFPEPRYVLRIFYFAAQNHYDLVMDCNPDSKVNQYNKNKMHHVHVRTQCFHDSGLFEIKETPEYGMGLYATDEIPKGKLVSIYPLPLPEHCYGNRNNIPSDCDARHIYIEGGVYYDNSPDVLHFVKNAATGIYEPTPEGTSIGLAMLINSSRGSTALRKNCVRKHVECTMVEERNRNDLNMIHNYKCVITSKVVMKGEQFAVDYNVDASDARIAESLLSEDKSVGGRRRGTARAAVDPAPKNFNAGVDDIANSSRTRKRKKEEFDTVDVADELHVSSKRAGRGKDIRKRTRARIIKEPMKEESKLKKVKAPKKEKTPKKEKAVVEKVTHEVDPENSELVKQLAIQKAHLESVFANQVKELEAEWASKLLKEEEKHKSMLDISELKLKAQYVEEKSALELRLQTQYSKAKSDMESSLYGCQIEILGLQRELEPFLQDRDHATMLSRFVAQDQAHVTDMRVENYRARELLRPARQPLTQHRGQQMLQSTEDAFQAFCSTQPMERTLFPALPPPPTQPALPPPLSLPALPAPPTPPTKMKIEGKPKNV